jgi:hypothetical protein
LLTVSEARILVGLQSDDTSRDSRLQQLINAAYEQATHFCGPLTRTPVTEKATVVDGVLLLRTLPAVELTAVTDVTDLTTLTSTALTGLVTGLPKTSHAREVTVTYVAGHDPIPASIEEGVRAWVKHRWLQESYGTDTYGTDAVSGAVTDFDGLPNAVANAWRPYLIDRGVGIA